MRTRPIRRASPIIAGVRVEVRSALAAVVLVVVSACGNVPPPTPVASTAPPPTPTLSPSPPPEQSLSVAIGGDLAGGLSNAANGADTRRVTSFLYEGLFTPDEHLAPEPRLASGPPIVSADGLTWTVTLRDDVTFHDGSALTANDVVATYELARSRNCRFERVRCLRGILESVVSVDELTVVFTLRSRLATFGTMHLGLWIESKTALDASFGRFVDGIAGVSAGDLTEFLKRVAAADSSPAGAAVDYAPFRADGEALLRAAGVDRPNEAPYTTAGTFDIRGYVRDVVARIRAIDASVTDRSLDALAAAHPYLDVQDEPIGTGPFTFVSYTQGEGVELAANEAYFRGAPNIKRLSFPIIATSAARGAALVGGEIDWDPALEPATFEGLRDDPDLRFVEYLKPSFLGLYFNLHPEADGLFLDRNLRQAVSWCFDKDAAVEAATDGAGTAIYTEIPPMSWAYPAPGSLQTYPLDPATATGLIEASGWTLAADGIYEKAGRRLSTVVAVRSGFPERSRWLASVGEQVRACGIDLRFKEVEFDAILDMLDVYPHLNAADPAAARSFDAYFGGFTVSLDPDPFALYHSAECSSAELPSTLNFGCYQNEAVDQLIEAGLAETNLTQRAESYLQYATLLAQDLPIIYAWSDKIREGLRVSVGTTASGGLDLDTPTWFRDAELLTNVVE